jgi:hypothetical protein
VKSRHAASSPSLAPIERDRLEQVLGAELAGVGANALQQLRGQLGNLDCLPGVRVNEGGPWAEAGRRPAVLVVDDAEAQLPHAPGLGEGVRTQRLEERDERRCQLD